MKRQNLYQILDIEPGSSPRTVRKAYHDLALRYHPDRITYEDFLREAENRFKLIIEAYEVLSDEQLRATYDFDMGYQSPTRQKSKTCNGPTGCSGLEPVNIPIIRVSCDLHLSDLYSETEKTIEYHRMRPCECTQNKLFDARNAAESILTQCRECRCSHRCVERITKTVTVPLGTRSGDSRLYKGEGHQPRREMDIGDLLVVFAVAENDNFKVAGNNLVITRQVSLWTALKGIQFELKLPNQQQVEIKYIDPISPGQAIVVPNTGLPSKQPDHSRGNLIVQFEIQFPTAIDDQTLSLIRNIND